MIWRLEVWIPQLSVLIIFVKRERIIFFVRSAILDDSCRRILHQKFVLFQCLFLNLVEQIALRWRRVSGLVRTCSFLKFRLELLCLPSFEVVLPLFLILLSNVHRLITLIRKAPLIAKSTFTQHLVVHLLCLQSGAVHVCSLYSILQVFSGAYVKIWQWITNLWLIIPVFDLLLWRLEFKRLHLGDHCVKSSV